MKQFSNYLILDDFKWYSKQKRERFGFFLHSGKTSHLLFQSSTRPGKRNMRPSDAGGRSAYRSMPDSLLGCWLGFSGDGTCVQKEKSQGEKQGDWFHTVRAQTQSTRC
ncbi:hypothetical protein TNCT_54301 [Trichonephila clavata]|uniref:Uncharacterized protein n=1 Tax=Trichonephila clavata TaxID=2740835 RepID=A0A8X6G847_TRICU|nr:hypothetical protein TNCT_54301 [Trichonephila clavata]